jgi:16S rRNA (adenine1518-N6/adenine1519-N6)-dimethyltransferase
VTFPRTARELRAALEARGIRPRRRHGQHFLTDPQAVDAIVRDTGVRAADRVVEVGTGPGLLTHALAAVGASVDTFEVDPDLLAVARDLADWPARVRFHLGDVLASKHALDPAFVAALEQAPRLTGRRLLVSNLPYGAGTPILLAVLSLARPPDEIVVMLQEEVVDKLLAAAGEPEYGAPSVAVGLKATGEVLRRFGPEPFWPRPRVRSAVVRLRPRAGVGLQGDEHRAFAVFTTGLFGHRRKVLRSALALATGCTVSEAVAALDAAGIPDGARVEEVSPERLLRLWRLAAEPKGA